jgi:hypothetical protein
MRCDEVLFQMIPKVFLELNHELNYSEVINVIHYEEVPTLMPQQY